MNGGFLGSLTGAMEGVSEQDVVDAAQLRPTKTKSPRESDDRAGFLGLFGGADENARSPLRVSPEAGSAATRLLSGTIYAGQAAEQAMTLSHFDERAPEMEFALETEGGVVHNLHSRPTTIGRGGTASETRLVISASTVSRTHCVVVWGSTGATCADLGSGNGTVLLRGDEVILIGSEPTTLVVGDRIATEGGGCRIATVVRAHA